GFAVFAALLLLNFISTSISYKKREIGILRAVGARSSDVFGIFFNESMIIAVISFVIAAVLALVACLLLNLYISNSLGLGLMILNFAARQLFLMLAVTVVTAFISSFFPVYSIARKKPIDAIKSL
ncbi:MAG: FtsX-like permease family protein, partial [Clostridiales bacterium]|nr:FtsX-like permease family protein [Clostridiales bacterium]